MKAHVTYVLEKPDIFQTGHLIEHAHAMTADHSIRFTRLIREGSTVYLMSGNQDCVSLSATDLIGFQFRWTKVARDAGVKTPEDLVSKIQEGKLS